MKKKDKQHQPQAKNEQFQYAEVHRLHLLLVDKSRLLQRALIDNGIEYQFDDLIDYMHDIPFNSDPGLALGPSRDNETQSAINATYVPNIFLMNTEVTAVTESICKLLNSSHPNIKTNGLQWVKIAINTANLELCNCKLKTLASNKSTDRAEGQRLKQRAAEICCELAESHDALADFYLQAAKGKHNKKFVRQALKLSKRARTISGEHRIAKIPDIRQRLFHKHIVSQRQSILKLEIKLIKQQDVQQQIELLKMIAQQYNELAEHYNAYGDNHEARAAFDASYKTLEKVQNLAVSMSRQEHAKAKSTSRLRRGLAKVNLLSLFRCLKGKPRYKQELDFVNETLELYIRPAERDKDLQVSFANRVTKMVDVMPLAKVQALYDFLASAKMQEVFAAVNFQFNKLEDDSQLIAVRALNEMLSSVANSVQNRLAQLTGNEVASVDNNQPAELSKVYFNQKLLVLLQPAVASLQKYHDVIIDNQRQELKVAELKREGVPSAPIPRFVPG